MDVAERFKLIGKHYGYPDCCIDAFISRVEKGVIQWFDHLTPRQIELSEMNTGFIPCESCTDKLYEEDISLKKLIKDRKHPYPFPLSDYSETEKMLNLKK